MGLRQLKKDKTRAQFLETALALFSQQGFESTTVNQIAAKVGVSPRTLLRYFSSKEDIVVSWLEEGMSDFLINFQSRPIEEHIELALISCARELLNLYLARKEFYLGLEYAIAASPQISSRKYHLTTLLSDEIASIIKSRQLSEDSEVALFPNLFPQVLFTIIRVVITKWVELGGDADLHVLFNSALVSVGFKKHASVCN